MNHIIRKILTTRLFSKFQRCCICYKLGVQNSIHSYMGIDKNEKRTTGKTCRNCFIDMLTEKE